MDTIANKSLQNPQINKDSAYLDEEKRRDAEYEKNIRERNIPRPKHVLTEEEQKFLEYNQEWETDYYANHAEEFFIKKIINQNIEIFSAGVINKNWLSTAYKYGYFPWYGPYDVITFVMPEKRAVFYLENQTFGRSLRKLLRKNIYEIKINTNKTQVMKNCALPRIYEAETWINEKMIAVYPTLPNFISVEAYRKGRLAGGLYGLLMGGIFCGESMFGFESDVTKIVFYALCQMCQEHGINFIDSQVLNDFTASLGASEIPYYEYIDILEKNRDKKISSDIFVPRDFSINPDLFKKNS